MIWRKCKLRRCEPRSAGGRGTKSVRLQFAVRSTQTGSATPSRRVTPLDNQVFIYLPAAFPDRRLSRRQPGSLTCSPAHRLVWTLCSTPSAGGHRDRLAGSTTGMTESKENQEKRDSRVRLHAVAKRAHTSCRSCCEGADTARASNPGKRL